jgi:hypothetical protein
LINKVGQQNLKYQNLPICAWEENFVWNGKTRKTNLGGSIVKQRLFQEMLIKIAQLSNS